MENQTYPYIKITQELYDKIKDILDSVGYNTKYVAKISDVANVLVINYCNEFGDVTNLFGECLGHNRFELTSIKEFLITVCELKDFKVEYVDSAMLNNINYHKFDFEIDENNKSIKIYEYDTEFELKNLKSGMVVLTTKGEKYLVVDDLLIAKHGFNMLNSYKPDLTHKYDSTFDIVEIFNKSNRWAYGLQGEIKHEETIWKR